MYLTALLVLGTLTCLAQPKFLIPNFVDLTIKTRVTNGAGPPQIQTPYLKGPRLQREDRPEAVGANFLPRPITIFECDKRAIIRLNPEAKTYRLLVIPNPVTEPTGGFPQRPKPARAAEVNVTIETVDTGEHRPVGPYQAERVRTTIKVEPGQGARTLPGEARIDGWYLDLPGLFCRDQPAHETWFRNMRLPSSQDRVVVHRLGSEKQGFVVEEASITKQADNTIVSRTEVLEISGEPLEDALFEPPADYSAAAPGHRPEPKNNPHGAP